MNGIWQTNKEELPCRYFKTGFLINKQLYFQKIRCDPSSLCDRNVKFCLLINLSEAQCQELEFQKHATQYY